MRRRHRDRGDCPAEQRSNHPHCVHHKCARQRDHKRKHICYCGYTWGPAK